MKKLFIFLLFLAPVRLFAPEQRGIVIERESGFKPYENAFSAVCQVESAFNPLAYNEAENAIGIVQIRECKVADYNRLTGSNIRHEDCYDVEVSKRVFMWHMEFYNPSNIDLAIMRWNGAGRQAEIYLQKVKELL